MSTNKYEKAAPKADPTVEDPVLRAAALAKERAELAFAREVAVAKEQASKMRYSERVAVPTTKGRPQQYHEHVTVGAAPNDYTIPYDPMSLKESIWRGFVLTEDRHGSRYVPVQMTYAQLQEVWRDEIVAWDTRVSQAERIEREFTSDAFTLRRGCWSDQAPRDRLVTFLANRGEGDKAPAHYLSLLIRKLDKVVVRDCFLEVIGKGYLGVNTKPADAARLIEALYASLTPV